MSDLLLVVGVAVITFASRALLMASPLPVPGGLVGRFLDVFPLALFVAIATSGLLAPEGSAEFGPGLAAALGGVIGAALFKRSLLAVLVAGSVLFYLARQVLG